MKKLLFIYLSAIAILLLPTVSFSQCSVCFNAATNFVVGSNPYSIVSADFNLDGFADLAVANWGSSSVSILLGTGTGSFGAATNFSVGTNPRCIVKGDFNADGKPDIATANDGSSNVSVLLGNGTGGFGAVTNFAVAPSPESIVSADFNADGKADLSTANYGSLNTSILLGTGTGSFGAATNYSTGASSFPYGICSADFNLDTKADLVTVSYSSNNLSRLTGNGAGGFGAATMYATGSTGAYSVCAADFNGDGKPDLAVANANTNNISRLTGSGTGTFGAATTYAAASFPFCVISADFNGDSKVDLAVANYSSNNVSVLMGMGTGAFCAAVNFGTGTSPTSVCSADFNGDGKPDLALSNNNSNNVSVLLNCSTILPIELLSFNCFTKTASGILLEWSTASETNNNYFKIERTTDGVNFETIGTVNGAGNSSQRNNYSFTDYNPGEETNYYRLTQVDFNGQSETFNIIACEAGSNSETSVVNVYTVSGALIQSFISLDFRKDMDELSLADGIYLIEITSGNEKSYLKCFRSNGFSSYGK